MPNRHARRAAQRRTTQAAPSAPHYTCCVARYHNPDDTTEIVRITAAIFNLERDALVDLKEYWDPDDPEAVATEVDALRAKYDANIFVVSEPVPLEKCPCGNCDGYMTRTIGQKDLEAIRSTTKSTGPRDGQ
jgi:hypothetical protein